MNRSQRNILLLIWILPVVVFSFFFISIRKTNTMHMFLILRTFCISLSFTALVSFLYRRTFVFGIAVFSGLSSIIIFGMMPVPFRIFYWVSSSVLIFIELKNIYKTVTRDELKTATIGFALVVLVFIPFFALEFSQPSALARLIRSELHNDMLYHFAIVAMLKVYHSVSLGLHGLGNLGYHFGSHLFMSGASSLTGLNALESYSHFAGFFAIPLLTITSISVAEEILPSETISDYYKKLISYGFIILGTGVFASESILQKFMSGPGFYESESYALSIILLFTFFSVLKADSFSLHIRVIIISAIFILMTLTKISTGFGAYVIFGFWALFSEGKFFTKLWFYRIGVLTFLTFLFIVIFLSINPSSGGFGIRPLQFIDGYVRIEISSYWIKIPAFVIFHFLFFFTATFFYILNYKSEIMKKVFPIWWVFGAITVFIVGLNVIFLLYLEGGSGYYFSNLTMFVVLPFLICVPQLIKNTFRRNFQKTVIAVMALLTLYYAPSVLWAGMKGYLINTRLTPPANQFSPYIEKLQKIRDDKTSIRALVYIPHTEIAYWKKASDSTCRSAGFIISGISERPAIFGWPSDECYGFLCGTRFQANGMCEKSQKNYTDSELITEAKRLGFERVDIVTSDNIRSIYE